MASMKWSRRDVLKAGGAGAVAMPMFVPASALGQNGQPGANDKVTAAIIGTGGRARAIADSCMRIPDMQLVAICDCFKPAMDAFNNSIGKGQNWSTYEDFEEMIDKENLDGVMVETTTHARAWITCKAMAAGMDAYIEKPMSLTIAEGREMVDCARHYNRVTQVGTQQRSMPINNWASDLVKNGAIGKITTVLAPNFVGPEIWDESTPGQPMPEGGKEGWWDIWTNQAKMRPYHPSIHHGWSTWWDYDSGGRCYGVTGWGTHSYDQINRALGTDETGPVEVKLMEPVRVMNTGKYDNVIEGDTGVGYHRLSKPVIGPRAKVRMKFANGTELRLELDGDWGPGLGAVFVGTEGKIEINRNKLAANPKELLASPDNPGPITKPETQYHVENWVECVKSRERCTADIEYGQRSSTLCYLVNIVREVGQVGVPLKWDPETEKFTNNDDANKLLSRERRAGYELPKLT